MSGIHDGVSKLWVLRRDTGLDLHGCRNELEAIDHLVRCALLNDATKESIQQAVTKALTHLDPEPRKCNCHEDCDAADAKAKAMGHLGADHCHDDCCEDCFGT
jgi:hypothetical protein